jgi:hypothetical protein
MRVIRLIPQQLPAGGQFMPADGRCKLDAPAIRSKRPGLVKGQVIHSHYFRRAAQRDTVPTQQPGDLQVARVVHHGDQNEGGRRDFHKKVLWMGRDEAAAHPQ